jgi:hypothetical protein
VLKKHGSLEIYLQGSTESLSSLQILKLPLIEKANISYAELKNSQFCWCAEDAIVFICAKVYFGLMHVSGSYFMEEQVESVFLNTSTNGCLLLSESELRVLHLIGCTRVFHYKFTINLLTI